MKGEDNVNMSSTYDGCIDMFSWGTSGYNHGAVCFQPWSLSEEPSDYYAYGQDFYDLSDCSGRADWGYNAIENGGNLEGIWRTLTKEEWDILKETCQKLYPNEELLFETMFTLLDIENKSINLNERKGLMAKIEASIDKTFYKNEQDATEYYAKKIARKKEMGGKYNDKFFDDEALDAAQLEENEAI